MVQKTRLQELDALRGISLFGILLVNIFIFHAPYLYYSEFYGAFDGMQGLVVSAVVNLAGGKFLFIFAFLFGYGVALQQKTTDTAFRARHTKRMAVLCCFGIVHLMLFWFGDILVSYAILGMLLLLFVQMSARTILWFGILFIFFRPVYYLIAIAFQLPLIEMAKPEELDTFILTFQEGSFGDIFRLRMKEFYAFIPENIVWYMSKTLGLFLIGFYAARKNLTAQIKENAKGYLGLCLCFISLSLLWIYFKIDFFSKFDLETLPMMRPVLIAINALFETLQGLAYIIGFILLFQRKGTVAKLFAPTGRLALTNYIMQSLICVSVFYSYGLGLYATLRPSDLIWLTIAIYCINIGFSTVYLRYYDRGPLEYLWRKAVAKWEFKKRYNDGMS